MDELTPQELNKFISEFLITVRKKEDNEEYEPNFLRAFFASFERHSKKNKLWTLSYERRPVRANSESASVKAKGSKTESLGFFTSVFQILNFRRTISTYFQGVLFYSK